MSRPLRFGRDRARLDQPGGDAQILEAVLAEIDQPLGGDRGDAAVERAGEGRRGDSRRCVTRLTCTSGATSRWAGPVRIRPGRIGPVTVKVPSRPVTARSAKPCPPSSRLGAALPVRPVAAARAIGRRPPCRCRQGPATKPSPGPRSRRSMIEPVRLGHRVEHEHAADRRRRSPARGSCRRSAATWARPSAILIRLSSESRWRRPVTAGSISSRPIRKRPMSMSMSGSKRRVRVAGAECGQAAQPRLRDVERADVDMACGRDRRTADIRARPTARGRRCLWDRRATNRAASARRTPSLRSGRPGPGGRRRFRTR